MKSVWQKIFSWTQWRQWIFYPISDVDVINKCYIWQPIILSVRFCIQCVLNDVSKLGCLLNCFNVLDFYSYKRLYKSTDNNTSIISHQHILNDAIFFLINLQYEIKKINHCWLFFSDAVMVIILLLTGLNSCVNPWIFLAFSGRMCSQTKLTSRQSGYTCTTGTESDGRYRSSSLYDGNPAIVKFGHMRNGNHMIFRNSRFWICQELLIFYLSVYK